MDQLLKVALQTAHTAGDLIGRNFQKLQNADIQRKGKNDFITRIDKEAEAIIGKIIKVKHRVRSIKMISSHFN